MRFVRQDVPPRRECLKELLTEKPKGACPGQVPAARPLA
jgi:hypothetical protein